MQDIPVSIQAMTGDTINELGVDNFEEFVKYLPNVVWSGRGPGQAELYIRGAATEQSSSMFPILPTLEPSGSFRGSGRRFNVRSQRGPACFSTPTSPESAVASSNFPQRSPAMRA